MSFFSDLIAAEQRRNELLSRQAQAQELAAAVLDVNMPAQTAALEAISDAMESIAAALAPHSDEPAPVGLLGPMIDDPADTHGGGSPMDLVAVIPDSMMALFRLQFPITSKGGNALIQNPVPYNPVAADPSKIKVTPNDGSEPDFPPAGEGFWLRGQSLGQTEVTVDLAADDGSPIHLSIGCNVTAEGVASGVIVLDLPIPDPHPTA